MYKISLIENGTKQNEITIADTENSMVKYRQAKTKECYICYLISMIYH